MEIERRIIESGFQIEERAEGKKGITGLGIVFDKRSVNLGGFVEIIKPEAVKEIDWNDTVSMTNHDPNFVIGRSPDTLKVKVEDEGVRYTVEPSEKTTYKDLVISIERKEIKGSSFTFLVERNGEEWSEDENGVMVRTITKLSKVYDLSPVVFPAYPDTTVAKRSMEEFKKTLNKEEKAEEKSYPIGLAEREVEFLNLKHI